MDSTVPQRILAIVFTMTPVGELLIDPFPRASEGSGEDHTSEDELDLVLADGEDFKVVADHVADRHSPTIDEDRRPHALDQHGATHVESDLVEVAQDLRIFGELTNLFCQYFPDTVATNHVQ